MSSYRNRLDIIADILSVVAPRAKKTQIMYRANLSYKLLTRYLAEVVEAGLVLFESGNHYTLTSKGRVFLNVYKEYAKLNQRMQKQLKDLHNQKKILEELCWNKTHL
ncbi:MAG: winged helix-turn-helix domain-containing protein [Candidatus Bathyarchaeia archaeon]